MNFLAHFHLATQARGADKGELLAGALMGDFVKGPLNGQLPPGIEYGVRLHRQIDHICDSHLQQRHVHRHFPPEWRRYLGIMLDLYFDKLLSQQWSLYHDTSLADFARSTLEELRAYQHLFDPRAAQFFARLDTHRLLEHYQDDDILESILLRIGQRFGDASPLAHCLPELKAHNGLLADEFHTLYDILLAHARKS